MGASVARAAGLSSGGPIKEECGLPTNAKTVSGCSGYGKKVSVLKGDGSNERPDAKVFCLLQMD